MKYILTTLISCLTCVDFAQSAQEATSTELSELITNHRYAIDISEGEIVGAGAEMILIEGQKADVGVFKTFASHFYSIIGEYYMCFQSKKIKK